MSHKELHNRETIRQRKLEAQRQNFEFKKGSIKSPKVESKPTPWAWLGFKALVLQYDRYGKRIYK